MTIFGFFSSSGSVFFKVPRAPKAPPAPNAEPAVEGLV